MKRLLICGSRCLDGFNIDNYIDDFDIELINGGAYGVDKVAEIWAKRHGIKCKFFVPDYNSYGRYAPLKRDDDMVDISDEVVAFWDGRSKGTRHTIEYALKSNKPTSIHFMEDRDG